MTPEQQRKLRTLAAGMVAAASAYREFATGWKEKPVRDPFKRTRVKDFEQAAEAGKELLAELEDK